MAFWHDLDRHGDRPAFIDGEGRTLGYADLCAAADAMPGLAGELVLLELDNSLPAMIAYLGALRRGMPAILINAGDARAADRMIETFRPAWRWSPAGGPERLAGAAPPVHPDLAIALSTSGTTGATKLVRLSAGAVDANARQIGDYLALGPDERAITTLPPGYSYGLSVLNSHLAAGASILLNEASVIDPGFRAAIDAHGATSIAGVPYTYELLERGGFFQALPASLRTMTQAGGRLAPERALAIGAALHASGRRFFVMYGQTEATARMAYLPPDQLADHPDCIGRAIPEGRIALVDPDSGDEHPERGELVYAGPNVMMGYAECAEDLARGPEVDRLRTGDLAEKVGPDLFRITSRSSRFLKLFGLRLSLDEIEREARTHGWDVIATGTDAQLVLASERADIGTPLVAKVAALYALPEAQIAFVPLAEVPRLASGKVDYKTISAAAAPLAPAAAAGNGDAEEALLRLFRRIFPRQEIAPEDSFLSLHGDSLTYIVASLGIEEITGALPEQWETRPIAELAQAATPPAKRHWARVEPGVAARAIAPLMVVANHAGYSALRGGAALLLIVAGANFARFSRRDLIERNYAKIARAMLVNVLIPYWLIVGGYEAAKRAIALPELLLINNFVGDDTIAPFETWFIQVLVQATLLIGALSLLGPVRRLLARKPFAAAFALLIFGAALAAIHFFLLEGVLHNGGRELTWQLWLFALGCAITFARDRWQRVALVGIALLIGSMTYGHDPSRLIATVGGTFLLLWVRKIPLPMVALPIVTVIGSSSMFIYMMHARAPVHAAAEGWPANIVRIGIGVALGVATWMLYEAAARGLRKLAGKRGL